VKLAVNALVVNVKFAIGGMLAGGVPVKFWPVTLALLTVTLRVAGENV
jgi:hypothetical protein